MTVTLLDLKMLLERWTLIETTLGYHHIQDFASDIILNICKDFLHDNTVAAQARAIDRIFEILIVGAKPRHSGQAAGAKQ